MIDNDRTISDFDRLMGALHGLPDIVTTKPATINIVHPLIGVGQTFIVQTFRQRSGEGREATSRDTIFVQVASHEGLIRMALPAEVSDAIARQRESVGSKNRKKAARAEAERRKQAGIQPGFLKARRSK